MVDIDSINCILLVTEIKARKINVVTKRLSVLGFYPRPLPTSASKPRLPRKLSLHRYPAVPCRRKRGYRLLLPPHRSLLAEGASRRESGGPVKAGVRSRSGASPDPSGRGGGGRGDRSRGGAEDRRVLPSTSEHTRGA